MLIRLKLLSAAIVLLLAAAGIHPGLARASNVKPSASVLARGTTVDGEWETDSQSGWWWWNGCDFCTDSNACQCFYSGSSGGGSGIFQVNINQYTTMTWGMEIDYTNWSQIPSGANWNYCYAASGEGWADDIGGNSNNYLDYDTTGLICSTPDSQNLTYTGSFIITAGGGIYADYQGAGTLGQGIYGRLPSDVVSQIQFNGNISQAERRPARCRRRHLRPRLARHLRLHRHRRLRLRHDNHSRGCEQIVTFTRIGIVLKRGNKMKIRSKVLAAAAALALTAIVSAGSQPALANSSKPAVLTKAPPTYLIGANGSSVNGFWEADGNPDDFCYYCDNLTYCACFLADSNDAGAAPSR